MCLSVSLCPSMCVPSRRVCMCVSLCLFTPVLLCGYSHVCEGQRATCVLPQEPSSLFFETGSLTSTWETQGVLRTHWLGQPGWPANSRAPSISPHPQLWDSIVCLAFLMERLNGGPQAHAPYPRRCLPRCQHFSPCCFLSPP